MTLEEFYAEMRRVLGRMKKILHYDIAHHIRTANGFLPKD